MSSSRMASNSNATTGFVKTAESIEAWNGSYAGIIGIPNFCPVGILGVPNLCAETHLLKPYNPMKT